MIVIFFLNGLFFGGLGLAAYLQLKQGGDFPLRKHLPILAAFGFACGITYWIDMFLASQSLLSFQDVLRYIRMIAQLITGLLLLRFGWGILKDLVPLPSWAIFIPGVLIVPIAFAITFAMTTFITPSPIEIPFDIWTRYLLYLPGSIMAGIGFLRQWRAQRDLGYHDISRLMLGTGLAFLFEAFVVGLIVPAAPYGPASYYNYDRVVHNAFIGEETIAFQPLGITSWLDYERVLQATGLPIEFWRILSAIAVTFFIVRGLGVFEAIRKRQILELQEERDAAQQTAIEAQIRARVTAESWTDALVNISRRILKLDHVDSILRCIIGNAQMLLNSDFVGLALLNENRATLELKCYSNGKVTEIVQNPIEVRNSLINRTLKTASPYLSEKTEPLKLLDDIAFFTEKAINATAIVHLNLDSLPIGVLWMARSGEKLYSETDLIWLECLADQVVIAIQHGLMTSHLQSLSIIEERSRIAREMHDGLAQFLGYLNLQAQTLETLYRQGREKSFQMELKQMREAIDTAQADVRENILSLRTTLANDKGLISAIDEYLDEFSIQTGIDTTFVNRLSGSINLSSIAEVQLVCILQEALTNVRKHAHASKVTVLMNKTTENNNEYLVIKIVDNGVGFMFSDEKRHFGLETMRERAQSVNAEINIHPELNKGTSIECKIPCLEKENMHQRSLFLLQ
jgi:signal transduction histidine kinase